MDGMGEATLIDIGVNLSDSMFDGVYHGKKAHDSDREDMIERAKAAGVTRMIVTCGSKDDIDTCLDICSSITSISTFTTIGIHPTRCGEFNAFEGGPIALMSLLREKIHAGVQTGQVVAVGECGLDYDRLHFCDKATQQQFFEEQFTLAEESDLPMFLHDRNSGGDFAAIMRKHRHRIKGGVVHSFTGTLEEARAYTDLDLFIGINGCSLKTSENLDVVREIPLERLMLETDCPWCEVRPTHAGHHFVKSSWPVKKKEKFERGSCVKGRAEPCHLVQVLEVVAGVKGVEKHIIATHAFRNTMRLFFKA